MTSQLTKTLLSSPEANSQNIYKDINKGVKSVTYLNYYEADDLCTVTSCLFAGALSEEEPICYEENM